MHSSGNPSLQDASAAQIVGKSMFRRFIQFICVWNVGGDAAVPRRHDKARREGRRLLDKLRATGDLNPQPSHKAGYKLERNQERLEEMVDILKERGDAGTFSGIGWKTQLTKALEEVPRVKTLYDECEYRTVGTLWKHLRAAHRARMRPQLEVGPRDAKSVQLGAREMTGAVAVAWPASRLGDTAGFTLQKPTEELDWYYDLEKMHRFAFFADNLTIDMKLTPLNSYINFVGHFQATKTNPMKKKAVGSMPVATWYHTVSVQKDAFVHLLHSGDLRHALGILHHLVNDHWTGILLCELQIHTECYITSYMKHM